MKFGFRTPSLKRRIAARTSWKRMVRHSMGLKAPRGMGVFTNPKKAIYNRVYSRTTVGLDNLVRTGERSISKAKDPLDGQKLSLTTHEDGSINCPRCDTNMGQPVTKGVFIRRQVYICPNCKLEAKVASKTE